MLFKLYGKNSNSRISVTLEINLHILKILDQNVLMKSIRKGKISWKCECKEKGTSQHM